MLLPAVLRAARLGFVVVALIKGIETVAAAFLCRSVPTGDYAGGLSSERPLSTASSKGLHRVMWSASIGK